MLLRYLQQATSKLSKVSTWSRTKLTLGEMMSHWQKNVNEFSEMYARLQAQPGLSLRDLARELNVTPSTILRRLPGMDEAGYRLYEDDKGKLYPFNKD